MQYKSIAVICAALVLTGCVSSLPVAADLSDYEQLPTAFARTPEENALETTEPIVSVKPRRSAAYAVAETGIPDTMVEPAFTLDAVKIALDIIQELCADKLQDSWYFTASFDLKYPEQLVIAFTTGEKYYYSPGSAGVCFFGQVYSEVFVFTVDEQITILRRRNTIDTVLSAPLTNFSDLQRYGYAYELKSYQNFGYYVYYSNYVYLALPSFYPATSYYQPMLICCNVPNMVLPVIKGYESYVKQNGSYKKFTDALTPGGSGSGTSSISGTASGTISDSGEINMDVNVSVEYPDGWTADYGKFEEPTAGASLDAELENTSNTFLSGVTDYLKIFLNIRGSIGFFWEAADRVFKALDIWTIILFALFMGIVFYLVKGV